MLVVCACVCVYACVCMCVLCACVVCVYVSGKIVQTPCFRVLLLVSIATHNTKKLQGGMFRILSDLLSPNCRT